MEGMKAIFDWCVGHWAFCAFVIGMIFEIPQFKLKPFTRLLRTIGKLLNNDVTQRINRLNSEVNELKADIEEVKKENKDQMKVIDMNDANFIRTTILDFANSLRQGRRHTQEEYDHIIDMNDRYEEYVTRYNIHNGRFIQAYRYILACYSDCLENNSFLA